LRLLSASICVHRSARLAILSLSKDRRFLMLPLTRYAVLCVPPWPSVVKRRELIYRIFSIIFSTWGRTVDSG